jgi:hypothetical protein
LPVKIFSTTQLVPPTTFTDTTERNNVPLYQYFVTATVGNKQSGPSNIVSATR